MTVFSRRALLAMAGAVAVRAAAPQSPNALLSPSDFGARGDGETKDSAAFQQAIEEAYRRGGGTVYVRPGRYLCGSIVMCSNVSLWLDSGAILLMSRDPTDFAPPAAPSFDPHADRATTDFHNALLSAEQADNISIFGQGEINCNREKGGGPKPIALRQCHHVSIRDITIRNAPSYNVSLLGCEHVVIDGVTIQNGFSDGIDPDCSRNVRISNCFVESVDDAICLKASGALGERASTENVVVSNCILKTASIHFKCGTESCGDFRNIALSNCTFQGGMGSRHGNPGVALYTADEGTLEGIVIDNIAMHSVGVPIALLRVNRDRCHYGGQAGPLRAVRISNVIARNAVLPSVIAGLPDAPIENVHLEGLTVEIALHPAGNVDLSQIPEKPNQYPDPTMFGSLPASDFFLRHVTGLSVRDLQIKASAGETRSALVADDVSHLDITGLEATLPSSVSALWLKNVRDSLFDLARLSKGGAPLCRVEGAETRSLTLMTNSRADVSIDSGVTAGAVLFR